MLWRRKMMTLPSIRQEGQNCSNTSTSSSQYVAFKISTFQQEWPLSTSKSLNAVGEALIRSDINRTHETSKLFKPWNLRLRQINYANSPFFADGWAISYQNFIGKRKHWITYFRAQTGKLESVRKLHWKTSRYTNCIRNDASNCVSVYTRQLAQRSEIIISKAWSSAMCVHRHIWSTMGCDSNANRGCFPR